MTANSVGTNLQNHKKMPGLSPAFFWLCHGTDVSIHMCGKRDFDDTEGFG